MKQKYLALNLATKGFAIPIIILCILVGGAVFFAAPIFGICGAVDLIYGAFDKSLPALQLAIVPTAFNFILGGLWLANTSIDVFSPIPEKRTKENNNDPCWKKRNIVWWTSIISLIVIVLAGWATAVIAFKGMEVAALASGIAFITLHSVGMLIFSLGGLGFLIYGKLEPEV